MKFADFRAGQVLVAGPHRLDADAIVGFAKDWDPQWFHTDPEAAERGRFEGLIGSGWQTAGVAMRLAVHAWLADSESFASPGVEKLRWPHPVRPGDALTLTATVHEARRSASKPYLGVLKWRWQLHNQHGVEVLDLDATSMFDLGSSLGSS